MRRTLLATIALLIALAAPTLTRAQDADKPTDSAKATDPAPHYYHLVFVVQELDAAGKPVNSRTYTSSVSTDRHFTGQVRTGSRIPIATGAYASGKDEALTNVQFQYIDVGVNFDLLRVVEVGRGLSIDLSAEISSVADALDARIHQPIIRQNRWHAPVLIPLGKPTVVFSSDSLDSKGSLQVTLTATPLQ
ncbi:MAG: hypothetical protein P4L40_07315 [Terracidiphilus sp.]|nr:hypothetical protein [Terracidiphilus sp.]